MILHLFSNTYFDPLIIEQFEEALPGKSVYLVFGDRISEPLEKMRSDYPVFSIHENGKADLKNPDGIILHSLSMAKIRFINKYYKDVPTGCSFWGSDFYNFFPELKSLLYGQLTRKYLNKYNKYRIYNLLKDKFFRFSINYSLWHGILNSTKVFSTVVPYEESILRKYINYDIKYSQMPVHSIEKLVSNGPTNRMSVSGNKLKILIGNSGNPTNNHLEIIDHLEKTDTAGYELYLPLTYGNEDYIKYICRKGNAIFGNRFHPVLQKLEGEDYYRFLESMDIFIFNSYRQQGIGTIVQALWNGGTVLLSNKNVTRYFYRDNNMNILSIEDDLYTKKDIKSLQRPVNQETGVNREALLKLYSNESVNLSIRKFLNYMKI